MRKASSPSSLSICVRTWNGKSEAGLSHERWNCKSYSLWLYYHRLHPGTLYHALQDYVEPKIELEQTRLRELEDQQRVATDSRAARDLARQVGKKAALVEELIQFGNDLKEAADRGFDPDLNDSVILDIAPLHKLAPWPDAATA